MQINTPVCRFSCILAKIYSIAGKCKSMHEYFCIYVYKPTAACKIIALTFSESFSKTSRIYFFISY